MTVLHGNAYIGMHRHTLMIALQLVSREKVNDKDQYCHGYTSKHTPSTLATSQVTPRAYTNKH